ncbi:hypothetical protein [Nocardioides sp.]|uniref:hypothetical protein n=1 Tax=Nocardioides sp. TaxID=35761 RepID=UPI002B857A54|nr:hypothetical protein [Nocardioides sp.]HXH77119.1 hypothetical protein [Nocardioides sp.]
MTMVGADTARLADLATEFGDAADELDELARRLAGSIERTDSWQGPSADRCKIEWSGLAQTQMAKVADGLNAASQDLRINAWAQDIASGDTHLYKVLGGLYDLAVTVKAGAKAWKMWKRMSNLSKFFRALAMPARGFAALSRTEALIAAGKAFIHGTSKNPVMRAFSRAALPMTVLRAIGDVVTGGGYQDGRKWATRGFAAAGGLGAVVLIAGGVGAVATAPITATVAAVAVTAYGLWGLANYGYDNRDAIGRAVNVTGGWLTDRWDDATRAAKAYAHTMLATPSGATR